MTNKNLITISSLTGAVATILPWIGGPFGISIAGTQTPGAVSMIALALLAIISINSPDGLLTGWRRGVSVFLAIVSIIMLLWVFLAIGLGLGMDADMAPVISLQYGFVISLVGSVASLYFSIQRTFNY